MGVRNDTELNLFFTNNCISFLGGGKCKVSDYRAYFNRI
jgi:hypothetical protein